MTVLAPVLGTLANGRCMADVHPLICTCGDTLVAVPTSDDDWRYRSTETGNTLEVTPNPILQRYTWTELAAVDIVTYSRLSAADRLGSIDQWHWHAPAACPEPHQYGPPECHGQPMRFAPSGWVCRVTKGACA